MPDGQRLPERGSLFFFRVSLCDSLERLSYEGTSRHPIWSEEAGDWVGLGELQRGEVVRTRKGTVAVASVKSCPEGACVYNIETQGEHVYHVGRAGILVHNNDELCSRITELMSKVDKLNAAERAELSRLMEAQDAAADAAKTTGKAADVDVNSTKAGKGDTVDGEEVVAQAIAPIIDSTKFASKVRSKLNQLRKKYPHVRKGASGAADAQELAEEAFRRGGGRVGPPVGQGADSALYFDDGPVTWVFKPDGTFWSMRTNSGWTA